MITLLARFPKTLLFAVCVCTGIVRQQWFTVVWFVNSLVENGQRSEPRAVMLHVSLNVARLQNIKRSFW